MSTHRTSNDDGAQNHRLVERIDAHYRPEPMDARAQARFDRELRRRMESTRSRPPIVVPALVTAAAALALWIALPGAEAPGPNTPTAATKLPRVVAHSTPPGETIEAAAPESESWTWEVLDSPDQLDGNYADDDELLPDDYAFIATVLMGEGV